MRASERLCPHCGARLADESGRISRTATAALLGLAVATSGCPEEPKDEYGPAPTRDKPRDAGAAVSASASASASAAASASSAAAIPEYGPPPTATGSAR